jgi:hypothetical protein
MASAGRRPGSEAGEGPARRAEAEAPRPDSVAAPGRAGQGPPGFVGVIVKSNGRTGNNKDY